MLFLGLWLGRLLSGLLARPFGLVGLGLQTRGGGDGSVEPWLLRLVAAEELSDASPCGRFLLRVCLVVVVVGECASDFVPVEISDTASSSESSLMESANSMSSDRRFTVGPAQGLDPCFGPLHLEQVSRAWIFTRLAPVATSNSSVGW